MEYAKLGNSNLIVSRICFGCWAIGGHGWGAVRDDDSIAAIHKALDLGINFFDTADVYGLGHSEKILSKALGMHRHEVTVATKFGVSWDSKKRIGRNSSPVYIRNALEQSLNRLKLDCIPLYQIHWPDTHTPLSQTMETLADLQEQGKIQYIGCSNFTEDQIAEAMQYTPLVSVQIPYSVIRTQSEETLQPFCFKRGISIMAFDTLARGILSGKYDEKAQFECSDSRIDDSNFRGELLARNLKVVEIMQSIGRKFGKTAAQVAIRWVLDHEQIDCVIVGMKTVNQVEQNVLAADWNLDEASHLLLSRAKDIV